MSDDITSCLWFIDDECAEAVRSFFDGMGWPLPTEKEYYNARGSKALVFLNSYGVVVNLTHDNEMQKEHHPHFLRPLFQRNVGSYWITIDPGYEGPVSPEESDEIYAMLKRKHRITQTDAKPENLTFVPKTIPRFPVLIDLDPLCTKIMVPKEAGQDLNESAREISALLKEAYPDPQETIYRSLREAANAAWPEGRDHPDPDGVEKFKRMCLLFKESGRMVASWENSHYRSIGATSRRYGQRLAAEERIPAI